MKIVVKEKEYELEDLHITGNCYEDREVTVSAGYLDDYMRVYTSDDIWLTKIKKCILANPNEWKIVNLMFHKDGTLAGVTAEAPQKCLSLRAGLDKPRNISEEGRKAQLEALQRYKQMRADSSSSD